MNKKTVAFALTILLACGSSFAQNLSAQNAGSPSEGISVGALSILAAPVVSVAMSGSGDAVSTGSTLAAMGSALIVVSIVDGGKDTVELIAKSASNAGKVSVQVTRSTAKELGLSVGSTLEVVKQSTGTALVASGKVLAFAPNAVGESLLHHTRVPGETPAQEAQQ